MAVISDLLSRVRLELGDTSVQFTTKLTGDGVTKDFYLTVKPVDATYLTVTVNNVTKGNPTDFTVEENIGMIHFTTAPASNAAIVVSGTHYRYFTTTELTNFVNTAVLQHTDNRTDAFGSNITITSLPPVEEYPVALLATVEALWALATDSAFDINITAPDGVNIPRGQRFQQLSSIISARKEQYRELCSALNVGLWRLEMGILRRVSRTTNKLVPIFMSQEIDDSTKPERVYMENNLKGRTPVPATADIYDIILTQGDTWSINIDLPLDVTTYLIKAQVRTYPESPILAAEITCVVTDAVLGKVTLSLTSTQTENLPLKSFWDMQVYKSDGSFNQTYVRGLVFADRQVTESSSGTATTETYVPIFTAVSATSPVVHGTPYVYQFSASGPDPVFYLESGALPTGLYLSTSGMLSGTPTTAGTYTFTIRAYSSGLVYTNAQNTLPTNASSTVSSPISITVS